MHLFKNKFSNKKTAHYDSRFTTFLQQRSNISRSVTANYIRDTQTNTLTSYFMFHFVYRFNIFKGGATREDMMRGPGGGRGGGFHPGADF